MRNLIRSKRRQEDGNILLVTLVTCLIIGFSLASYLTLVSFQNYSTMRSLAWNSALPIMEAGVEEALTHLHHAGLTNLSANGWTFVNGEFGGTYAKTRHMGDSYYQAYILPVDPPRVFSRGFTPAPVNPIRKTAMILASLVETDVDVETRKPMYLTRAVAVDTESDGLWVKGMVAKGKIDLNGNNIATDSFDSRYDTYSTGGMYDPAKSKDKGDVATNSDLVNSLSIGNAKIKGHIATGPGGSVDIGPQGSVGHSAWVDGGNKGIVTGWFNDDMRVDFPDVEVPWANSMAMSGNLGGTNYSMILASGDETKRYLASSVSGKVYVAPNSTVLLHVTDAVDIKGTDYIYISPGSTLIMVVGAGNAAIGGNGVINPGGNALAFQYYGLPSNTGLSFGGNAAFSGVIYAPEADFQLNGAGKDIYDFVGASITKTVKMNGHFKFHYDEALADLGPNRGYIVTDWNEI